MNESEKLTFYSHQLTVATKGHPEKTVWKDKQTAQSYWDQTRNATEWCSGYATGIVTRLQAKSNKSTLSVVDIIDCETLDQLKAILEI